jgi:hypothetical protein
MNVEIRPEAAQFPEKEYINGIFLAVCTLSLCIFLRLRTSGWLINYDAILE